MLPKQKRECDCGQRSAFASESGTVSAGASQTGDGPDEGQCLTRDTSEF